jgi:hypothetical protein
LLDAHVVDDEQVAFEIAFHGALVLLIESVLAQIGEDKYPGQVSQEAITEAEAFLDAIVAALKPVCEGNSNLDPEMGIPAGLANDFRSRAYNRAANGIGTLAVASVALEDLQAVKETQSYQPMIDRYRKSVEGWVKNWENMGCMYTEADGKTYFYYAYAGTGEKRADGFMLGSLFQPPLPKNQFKDINLCIRSKALQDSSQGKAQAKATDHHTGCRFADYPLNAKLAQQQLGSGCLGMHQLLSPQADGIRPVMLIEGHRQAVRCG